MEVCIINIKLRNAIKKNKALYAFAQWLVVKKSESFYKKINKTTSNLSKILALKDSAKGKKCYIVGNGPSLTMEDLELIKSEDCFASNLIFKIFDKTNWRPKYYFILDRYADTKDVLNSIDLDYLFVGDYFWKYRGMKNKNAICIHTERNRNKNDIGFSVDATKVLYSHFTVTHAMIQMAVYMGYKKIYLIGMDHNYSLEYDSNGKIISNSDIKSHVFKDEKPADVVANIEGMNKAYIACRKYCDDNNVEIYNSTRGGKLEWFKRKNLLESLKNE